MKNTLLILYFISFTFFAFSQNCDKTRTIVLNGEIYDFQLDDCTSHVTINTSGRNTDLHGITFIDPTTSINIKPTGNNRITIKPDDSLDFINLLITSVGIKFSAFIESAFTRRTRGGNSNADAKDLNPPTVRVFPNPVDSQLTIESSSEIVYYKILDSNGSTEKEGTLPTSSQLELSELSRGVYYLLVQTDFEVEVIRLHKN